MGSRIFILCAALAAAAAFAEERNTQRSNPDQSTLVAGGRIEAGHMVCQKGGLAWQAADTNALSGAVVVGIASRTVSSNEVCLVQRGRFRLDNKGAALTAADVGKDVYVAGPASVTTKAAASQDIRAGVLAQIQPGTDGTNNAVWVNIRF